MSTEQNPPAPQSGPAGASFILPPQDTHPAMLPDILPGDAWATDKCLTADQIKEVDDYLMEKYGLKRCEPSPSQQPAPSSGKAEGVAVKRFDLVSSSGFTEHKYMKSEADGDWVQWEDYQALTAAAAEREKELREAHLAVIHYDEVIHEITGDESDDDGATVIQRHVSDLRAQLTSTREQLREREAEVERVKANIGCARNQGSTQFCHEAVQHAARVAVLEEALRRIAAYDVPDAHEMIRIAKAALTPPPPPAVDGRRGEGKGK